MSEHKPEKLVPNLLSCASELDDGTREQAERISRSPILAGHVALMPDAHLGIGATPGTVLATGSAVIPAAVGVDLGCGLAAVETDLVESDLPHDLRPVLERWQSSIPSGVGKGREREHPEYEGWSTIHHEVDLDDAMHRKAACQFGTLGSGNHFVEAAIDEQDRIWGLLRSGSRGVGNTLAQQAIKQAQALAKQWFVRREDPGLAYLVQGTPEFSNYITAGGCSPDYAQSNRYLIGKAATEGLPGCVGKGQITDTSNCHHIYTEREHHFNRDLWISRKGAIRARVGDRSLIPGSMGAASYLVEGLGKPASYGAARTAGVAGCPTTALAGRSHRRACGNR